MPFSELKSLNCMSQELCNKRWQIDATSPCLLAERVRKPGVGEVGCWGVNGIVLVFPPSPTPCSLPVPEDLHNSLSYGSGDACQYQSKLQSRGSFLLHVHHSVVLGTFCPSQDMLALCHENIPSCLHAGVSNNQGTFGQFVSTLFLPFSL